MQGTLKRKDTIVTGGIENTPQALVDLFAGKNTGKMMVEVAPMSAAVQNNSQARL